MDVDIDEDKGMAASRSRGTNIEAGCSSAPRICGEHCIPPKSETVCHVPSVVACDAWPGPQVPGTMPMSIIRAPGLAQE